MKRISALSLMLTLALVSGSLVGVPASAHLSQGTATVLRASAAKLSKPLPITSVSSARTSKGEIRVRWTHDGSQTTSQRIHVATSSFNSGGRGKNHIIINLSANQRSYTLTAEQLKKVKSPIGSARMIWYRVEARNERGTEALSAFTHGESPTAIVGQPNNEKPAKATTLDVATYNVVTATASPAGKSWTSRKKAVAAQIVKADVGIVGLQEAITYKQGSSTQIKQLLSEVQKAQKAVDPSVKWKLTRSTRYVSPKVKGGEDGSRILYDSARYKLLTACRDSFGSGASKNYSASCSMKLPRYNSSETQTYLAYAQFEDRKTKERFWVASFHLKADKASKYDSLRAKQTSAVLKKMNQLAGTKTPVIFLADTNSSTMHNQKQSVMNQLLADKYIDSASAVKTTNLAYNSYNHWTKQSKQYEDYGYRIDYVMARGKGVHFASHVMYMKNAYKASDHNLIKARILIP